MNILASVGVGLSMILIATSAIQAHLEPSDQGFGCGRSDPDEEARRSLDQ
jgi:hypothetical protein